MVEDSMCALQISQNNLGVRHTYHRFPAKHHLGFADVGSSPLWVILGLRKKLDLASAHCVCVHGSVLKDSREEDVIILHRANWRDCFTFRELHSVPGLALAVYYESKSETAIWCHTIVTGNVRHYTSKTYQPNKQTCISLQRPQRQKKKFHLK